MQHVIQYIKQELTGIYPENEIQGFVRLLAESILGLNYTDLILQKDKSVTEVQDEKIKAAISRLKKQEPIQYILGETEFYGLKLKVTPSVLIPRPETEELVHWIVETNPKQGTQILDIGSGSGCIPLGLKKQCQDSEITSVDISEKALEVARENARLNNLTVTFFQADILKWEQKNWEKFDVIVSNPPYVRELEKKMMQPNVLDFEPKNALFVSNDDPLIFYRRIAEFAKKYLQNEGWLFFEINEYLATEMSTLMVSLGFRNIEIRKDINGKKRMLRCKSTDV